ncbi:quinolinate synthase NadA [Seinonella peptonophila]|nr:quinolinate synthase NadA [Seinonella peptonophila]
MESLPKQYQDLTSKEYDRRILSAKEYLGKDLVILGHHYQRDEVIQFADYRGDSLKLAKLGAAQQEAKYIVFCGVHFMAETADTLANDEQVVILPDLRAGCSMADMADIDEVEEAWDELTEQFGDTIIPVTYVNSTAAIKAFVGRKGGTTCTSSNAHAVLKWAFQQKKRILFLPDQHLGRNTAYDMGISLDKMIVWNPRRGELEQQENKSLDEIQMILWKGHCSVHQKFTVDQITRFRKQDPAFQILVHPECNFDVVQQADLNGSTEFIIQTIRKAPAGSKWAIGTEVNLVQRLAHEHPEQDIRLLSSTMCPCLTMNRIDRPHLLWVLEELVAGNPIHQIKVDDDTIYWSKQAIERMLAI